MYKLRWGFLWLAILEALHCDSAGRLQAQVPGQTFVEIWAGKTHSRKLWCFFTKKSSNLMCWMSAHCVHLYKRAQSWLQVGFCPKSLCLQWQCVSPRQIRVVSKGISGSVRGRVSSPQASLCQCCVGNRVLPCFAGVRGLLVSTLQSGGGRGWFPAVIVMKRRNLK